MGLTPGILLVYGVNRSQQIRLNKCANAAQTHKHYVNKWFILPFALSRVNENLLPLRSISRLPYLLILSLLLPGDFYAFDLHLAAAVLRVSASPWCDFCILGLFIATLLFANAQSSKPLDGQPWDFGVWAGGGFSVPGGTKDTHAINAGVRLGKVLTDDHLGGFLRGNFEWSADLIPSITYGNPLQLKMPMLQRLTRLT